MILTIMDNSVECCDTHFLIRSYGKGELAMRYIQGVAQQSAVNQFNRWVHKVPGLEQRLLATGLSPTVRRYTPVQVQLIVDALGEP